MVDSIESFRSLVKCERYDYPLSWIIPGVVRGADSPNGYDLDDLIALVAPRTVQRLSADAASHLTMPFTT
jgi:hypothetical protein